MDRAWMGGGRPQNRVGARGGVQPRPVPTDAHREARLAAAVPVAVWPGDLVHQGPSPYQLPQDTGRALGQLLMSMPSSIHTGRAAGGEKPLKNRSGSSWLSQERSSGQGGMKEEK